MNKKKSLGQHFLSDALIAERIVSSAEINNNSTIIEIGPGEGSLTKWIYESNPKRVILVELDIRLLENLKTKFPNSEIINQDFCKIDLSKLRINESETFTIIGNLPYNVSTRILERIVNHQYIVDKMVLMFQKEVGGRIYANVGTKDYGRLTLLSQEFFKTEKLFILGKRSFSPPPKVDSVIIKFEKRDNPLIDLKDRLLYDQIIRHVFTNRRKMIRRSLRALCPDDVLEKVFKESGLDRQKRPEELTIQEFALLSNIIYKCRS